MKKFKAILVAAFVFSTFVSVYEARADEETKLIICSNCDLSEVQKEVFDIEVTTLLFEHGIDADFARVLFTLSEATVAKKSLPDGMLMTKMTFVAHAHGDSFRGSVAFAGTADSFDIHFLAKRAIEDATSKKE